MISGNLVFILVAAYFLFLLGSSFIRKWRSNRVSDFTIADRKLGLFPFVASLVGTTYGWILGSGQIYYEFGISAWLNLSAPYLLFSLLFALFFARKARNMQAITLTDILGKFYNKRVRILSTAVLLLFLSPVMYLLMAGQILSFITGWDIRICIAASTLFSTVYVFNGGFKTMVRTEIVQFLLMFAGFIGMVVFLFVQHGVAPLQQVPAEKLHFGINDSWWYMGAWFLLASVTLVDPSYNQRVYAVKSPSVAVKGIIIAIVLWLVFDVLSVVSALYGFSLAGDLSNTSMVYPVLAAQVLPGWLCGLFFIGLLSMVMSTADSFLFLSSLTISKDIFHELGWFKKLEIDQLTRRVLIFMSLLSMGLTIYYAHGTVVDVFFDFVPIVVSVVLMPLLGCYIRMLRLSSGWVLGQMLVALLVCFGFTASKVQVDGAVVSPVYFGLAAALLMQAAGMVARILGKRG